MDDFQIYLNGLSKSKHIILMDQSDQVLGWCVTFNRDNQRWFVLLLHSSLHGQRLGSSILDKAKQGENELNGWVVTHNKYYKRDGTRYISPAGFYQKNNFTLYHNIKLVYPDFTTTRIIWTPN